MTCSSARKYLGRFLIYICIAIPLCDVVSALAQRGGVIRGGLLPLEYRRLRAAQWLRDRINPRVGGIPQGAYERAVARKRAMPKWQPGVVLPTSVRSPNARISRTLPGTSGATSSGNSRPGRLQPGLNTNAWTSVGPRPVRAGGSTWSGRVNDVTVDPNNPRNIYIAAAQGGVWFSNDAGNTWTSLTDFILASSPSNRGSLTASAVAIDPNTVPGQHILYVGTGDGDDQNVVALGGAAVGFYRMQVNPFTRSVSNVSQFTTAAGINIPLTGQFISRIRIDPLNMNTMYLCGSFGLLVTTNASSGNPPTFDAFTFPPSAGFAGPVRDIALDPLSRNASGTNLTIGYVARDGDRVYRIAPKNPDPANQFGLDESCTPPYAGLPSVKTLNRTRWDISANNTCNAANLNLNTGATVANPCFWNADDSNFNTGTPGTARSAAIRGGNGGIDGDVIGTVTNMTAFTTPLADDGFLHNIAGQTIDRISITASRQQSIVAPADRTVVYCGVGVRQTGIIHILRWGQNAIFDAGIFRTCTPPLAAPPANWTEVAANVGGQEGYDNAIAASQSNINICYFGGSGAPNVMQKTINSAAFANFDANGTLHADTHAITIDPRNENLVYTGNDGGIWSARQTNAATDTTANFQSLNDRLDTALVLYVASHPTDPNILFCGTQDKGVAVSRGLSNSTAWDESDGGDGGQIVIDNRPGRANNIIHVMPFPSSAQNVRRSTDGGITWSAILNGIQAQDRQRFYPPVAMDEKNPDNVYFGTFRIYQTTSQGNTWTPVTSDLSSFGSGVVTRIAVAPKSSDGFNGLNSSDFVYAGTDDGALWMTDAAVTNNTKPWVRIDNAGVGDPWPGATVSAMAVDPINPRTVYVTFSNIGSTHVFMIQNAGLGLTQVNFALSPGTMPDVPASAITTIPMNPNPPQLCVATDIGVFQASSPGAAWSRMDAADARNPDLNGSATGQSLPNVGCQDIVYNANTQILYVGTYGRSVWAINIPSSIVPVAGSSNNFRVTSTGDSGAGTLRQAIVNANTAALAGATTGTIAFEIPNIGVKTITLSAALPTLTAPGIAIDGFTQQNFVGSTTTTPVVKIDGNNLAGDGLRSTGANTWVRGLCITRFSGAGIHFTGVARGSIQGCFIGVDTNGVTPRPNGTGVLLDSSGSTGSSNCIIGGGNRQPVTNAASTTTPAGTDESSTHLERNVISGNLGDGAWLIGTNTSNNSIQNNFIGTDVTGSLPVGNGTGVNKGAGVRIDNSSSGNIVGGTTLFGGTTQAGVLTATATNVIAANGTDGVLITGTSADNNIVSYNLIGTDRTGAAGAASPNPLRNRRDGVRIEKGAKSNTIGDATARTLSVTTGAVDAGSTITLTTVTPGPSVSGNVICGSIDAFVDPNPQLSDNSAGIRLTDPGTELNQVRGNIIGLEVTGTKTAGSGNNYGVKITAGARANTVGGTVAQRNIVSGNVAHGVQVIGAGTVNTRSNVVSDNFIGTDSTGTAARGNNGDGVRVDTGAELTVIGSANAADRNVVSANGANGIHITGVNSDSNSVQNNFVGVNAGGTGVNNLGNLGDGLQIDGGASNNGPPNSVITANVFSGNLGNGVHISGQTGTNTSTNTVAANFIGVASDGVTAIPNGTIAQPRDGVLIDSGAQGNTVTGNTVSGNTANGIHLKGNLSVLPNTTGNTITNNQCGSNSAGTTAVPNLANGLVIDDSASSNTITGNTISGNAVDGVRFIAPVVVSNPSTASNTLAGNFIGTRTGGAANTPLPNSRDGIRMDGTLGGTGNNGVSANVVGNSNVISGNVANGITITGPRARLNLIRSNSIGLDVSGSQIIANNGIGVLLSASANNNTIGDTTGATRNFISGNTSFGVQIRDGSSNNNLVVANFIGVDSTGVNARGNKDVGLIISGSAANNTIGGAGTPANAGRGNILGSNNFMGVRITGASTTGNRVQGNFVGVDLTGAVASPNGLSGPGIVIDSTAATNTIGGTNAGEGNVISGNTSAGIDIGGVTVQATINPPPTAASSNLVFGNTIGLNAAQTLSLSNAGDGILIGNGSSSNTIGGTAAGTPNISSGNVGNGIQITGTGTNANVVQGNLIGVDAATNSRPNGTTTVRKSGVLIASGAQNNVIGSDRNTTPSNQGNTIRFNTQNGVQVTDGATGTTIGNAIRGNSIQSNARLGIDLVGAVEDANGVTANDTNDADNGANRLQNFPLLTGAANNGTNTVVNGQISSTTIPPSPGNSTSPVNVDFYVSPAGGGDPSGNGEGQTYLGTLTQITLQTGIVNFTATLAAQAPNSLITAICTDASGNSSEFSNICLVVSATGPVVKVTTTQDNGNNTTPTANSLRAAIIFANSNPGTTIVFEIPVLAGVNTQDGSGAFVIQPPVPLPPIAADGTKIDGSLESGFLGSNPNGSGGPPIVISGASAGAGATGLDVRAQNCQIRNLVINNFAGGGTGIFLNGAPAINTQVTGCRIGLTSDGATAAANGVGVKITSGTQNTIGGVTAGLGNVISSNTTFGVQITGASNNTVQGNTIGLRSALDAARPNATGVEVDGTSQSNTIGPSNIISGNTNNGVLLTGANVRSNVVGGNRIGINSGATRFANDAGVRLDAGALINTIGGVGGRNIISGNITAGVLLDAAGTVVNPNRVTANFIGTNAGGTGTIGGQVDGVLLRNGSRGNFVGGSTANNDQNTISGNTGQGVHIVGANTTGNIVAANFIGTDATGTAAIANAQNGVRIDSGAQNNTVGVAPPAAISPNVVSGNGNGIRLTDSNTSGNLVAGNTVGLDSTGATSLGNAQHGILIDNNATGNTIGGDTTAPNAALRNIISGNGVNGVDISAAGSVASPNLVQGNFIGTNPAGNGSLGNVGNGVQLEGGALGNLIGTDGTTGATGTNVGLRNIISGNSGNGLVITGTGTLNNVIAGNFIGTASTGASAVPNSLNGVFVDNGSNAAAPPAPNQIGGTPATPNSAPGNVISGNTQNGVLFTGVNAKNNVLTGNLIGLNAAGAAALANGQDGVRIDGGAQSNTIGGTTATSANVISGNSGSGVHIVGVTIATTTTLNSVQGNLIGLNAAGAAIVANVASGVRIDNGAQNNVVGGTAAGAGNRISGNTVAGVQLVGTAAGNNTTNNLVQANTLGGVSAANAALPNGQGVQIDGGAQSNTVGGAASGAGNLIAANSQNGLLIRGSNTSNNIVAANTIGRGAPSDAAALANNANGVLIDGFASGNTIGGSNTTVIGTGSGNFISGNGINGVRISAASANVLLGNIIGADTTGTTAVANRQNGVAIDTSAATNTVGLGTANNPGNLISGNTNQGVLIDSSTGNVVKANLIGMQVTGSGTNRTALANGGNGVLITNGATNNVIGDTTTGANAGGNTIAFNNLDGVRVTDGNGGIGSSNGNAVRGNSLFSNTGLGVNLVGGSENSFGVTANDAGDGDSGPNRLQNWPQLTGASVVGGNLTVNGTMDSTTTNSVYPIAIDFYVSASGDPSGNGEGATYVGTATSVSFQPAPNQPGSFSFSQVGTAVTAGQVMTAAATDAAGNSSEFSNICVTVAAQNVLKVTTTADNGNNANPTAGSLRKAMIDANLTAAAGGVTIVFQIPTSDAGFSTVVPNVFTIQPAAVVATPLPTITRNDVTLDGTSEAVFLGSNPNAVAGGPLIAILGSAQLTDGITVGAGVTGTKIKNLNIFGFPAGAGIKLSGSSAAITGCWIGPTAAGAGGAANANQGGVAIQAGASSNTIGGTAATDSNLISNNTQHGIQVASNNNVVLGNFIGTNPSGTNIILGGQNGLNGILVTGSGNLIGGTAVGARNLISGNGNQAGATTNGNGIRINGAGAVGNQVVGNRIGTNDAATGAIANSQNGVLVDGGASANTVGVTTGVAGSNVISGNTLSGVVISASNNNVVAGNLIGIRASGASAVANLGNGVQLDSGASSNTIGGTADPNAGIPGNVISGNSQNGVLITGANTGSAGNPNVVQGNIIGANAVVAPGTTALGNVQNGVQIASSANGNIIGINSLSPNVLQGNLISGNAQNGVLITSANNTQVFGNNIGANLTRTAGIANVQSGVLISGGARNNTIGDVTVNLSNTIAFNTLDGVRITDGVTAGSSINNSIRGNAVFSNGKIGTNLVGGPGENATTGVTPNVGNHAVDGPNHFQNFPVLASAVLSGTTLTVGGSLDSTAGAPPNASYPISIDLYASDQGDPSGNGEGQRFLGSTATALTGPGSFTFQQGGSTVNSTQFISAVATDSNGNSSEFSNVCPVVSAASSVMNVTNTKDDGLGSLRQAITKANGIPGTGAVTIQFNIPATDTGFANSVFNIQPSSSLGALPAVTRPNLIIDGATESAFLGGNPNSAGPPILISGANLTTGTPNGITLSASGCEVRSLIINGFAGSGVRVQGNNCRITGCYFGTDRAGIAAAANGTGITLSNVAGCTIGGTTGATTNLISGNTTQGVLISGGGGNNVVGNIVGVNRLGTTGDPLSNGSFGVFVQSASINNTIGGTNSGEGNLIAFNPRGGVIIGSSTSDQSTSNRILRNSIFKNSAQGGLGIDLANDGVTQNDIGDSDSGPNNLMNSPLITTVTQSGNTLTVSGIISKPIPANSQIVLEPITVDIFGNFTDNPSGFGEGGTWMASTSANANGDWSASFAIPTNAAFFSRTNADGVEKTGVNDGVKYAPLPSGALTFITTMATDANGNSSEFSKPRPFGGAVFTQSYPQGLNMLSIPRNLSQFSNNDLAAMFKLPAGSLRLALWDAVTQQYQLFGQPGFTTLNNLGRGYFINLTQPVTVSISGQQFTRPFRWNLSQGWNLMGNMGDTDMRYVANQITVFRNGADFGTVDRVFQVNPISPVVDPFVWIFDNPTNAYQLVHDLAANLVNVSGFVPAVAVRDRVPKGGGAWVFCRENNVALQFNDSIFSSPVLREGALLAGRSAATSMDINRWAAQLAAQAGDAFDGSAVFGVNANTGGTPGFLAQKPPVPAIRSQFVRVTFERDNTGDFGYDIRPALNGNTHWNVNVTTNQTNEDVLLSWPKLSTLPRDLRFTLVDTTTGARQFMNTTGAYHFRAGGSSPTRRLRIEVSTDSGSRLALQGVNVQLQRAGTSSALRVMYSLNRDAQVTTRLINPAGKIINQLPPQPARTGLNNLILEAKDSLGRVPARGLYLLEITARTDDGDQVTALQSAILK